MCYFNNVWCTWSCPTAVFACDDETARIVFNFIFRCAFTAVRVLLNIRPVRNSFDFFLCVYVSFYIPVTTSKWLTV